MNSTNNWLKQTKISSILFLSTLFYAAIPVFADINNEPKFDDLRPILVRIINVLLISSGAVLVAMIAYGVWKSSLATGDPRGLEGAKLTWTYAIYGFFVIVGAFAIFIIAQGMLGISSGVSGGLAKSLIKSINDLLNITSSSAPKGP